MASMSELRWSEERDALLKELWPTGLSARKLAERLNKLPGRRLTVNAVIGRRDRMGLTPRSALVRRGNVMDSLKTAKPKRKPLIVGSGVVMEQAEAPPSPYVSRESAFEPLPSSAPKPWLQRRFGECAWIVGGEGAEALSCCLPVAGKSWCAAHLALGTDSKSTLASRSANELMRSLRRYAA